MGWLSEISNKITPSQRKELRTRFGRKEKQQVNNIDVTDEKMGYARKYTAEPGDFDFSYEGVDGRAFFTLEGVGDLMDKSKDFNRGVPVHGRNGEVVLESEFYFDANRIINVSFDKVLRGRSEEALPSRADETKALLKGALESVLKQKGIKDKTVISIPVKDPLLKIKGITDGGMSPFKAQFWSDKEPVTKKYLGVYSKGEIRPMTDDELKKMEYAKPVQKAKANQLYHALKPFEDGAKPKDYPEYWKKEDEIVAEYRDLEDKWIGRKPNPKTMPSEDAIMQRTKDWVKSMGFSGEGVNGFTSEQTWAHDVAHPVTHDLIGMDSKGLKDYFGSTVGIFGEEAIVNVVEHLSRGDAFESSVMNGLRIAKALARSTNESDGLRAEVRTRDFKDKLIALATKAYTHNNYSLYMDTVRKYNRISTTVTMAGNDFTRTATGG